MRVPSFIDDVISAMKQMGEMISATPKSEVHTLFAQICRWRESSERMAIFDA